MKVEFVIGAVIILVLLLIWTMIRKKQNAAEITQLERKKTELLHRPINEELTKVKRLNMTGQTESLFDRWRTEWDEVVTMDLPAVDELLFVSEEQADKFRFGAAKKTNAEISEKLGRVEQKVNMILSELEQLVGSEEKNRAEGEEMYLRQREAKKRLLAHRHTFGKAAPVLEAQLDALTVHFDRFADLTEEGNYLEARELLMEIQVEMNVLEHKLTRIPPLMAEVNHSLTNQLAEIEQGYKEMQHDGYLLDHLQIEKEVTDLKEDLARCREFLMKTEVNETERIVSDTKDSIDFFYDLLEKEVVAKHDLLKEEASMETAIIELDEQNEQLIDETELVKQTYQLDGTEAEVPEKLKEEIYHLAKQYEILHGRIEEQQTAYSFLNEELKDIKARMTELKKEQDGFSAFLKTLRKDEIEAAKELLQLRAEFQKSSRKVQQSNLPGVPAYYREAVEDARIKLHETQAYLNEKPLNMKAVQEKLESAKNVTEYMMAKTDELLEQAVLSERMIQFGNRYRRTHPNIGPKLTEAEDAFRQADYGKSLELCATAIEQVDSKGLKRFDAQYRAEQQK